MELWEFPSFLNKYCPTQFEILGMTHRRYEFGIGPTKVYKNAKQINPDGSVTLGSKINMRLDILYGFTPTKEIYYIADNADGPLMRCYARIIIRRL